MNLTNQIFLKTLFTYTLSWYTPTWFSTLSLATRNIHCCVAFLFFSELKARDIISTGQYINYQTFSNLHLRPLLKNFSNSIHIDLRDTSGEKIPFVSVGIIHPALMFRKACNIHFLPKKCYKMVASRQVKIPFYRGIGRQRGRGFGALAKVIGRTAIPFLRKYIVPATQRVGADLLEFAVPELAEVVSGRKIFKTAAKRVERQILTKQLGSGSRKKTASRVIPTKSVKQTSRSRRVIFTKISH